MPTVAKSPRTRFVLLGLTLAVVISIWGGLLFVASGAMTVAQATVCRHMISRYEHQSGQHVDSDADLDHALVTSPELLGRDVAISRPRIRLTTENGVRILTIREDAWPHREYRYPRTAFDAAPKQDESH